MTILRKNTAHMTDAEWTAFCNALLAMKAVSAYDNFVVSHARAVLDFDLITALKKPDFAPEGTNTNGAHLGPAFLPWHRALLMDFETELQKYFDPAYKGARGIPYWDWTRDPDGWSVFKPQYLGTRGTPLTDGMFSKWECVRLDNGSAGTTTNIGPLNREFGVFASMPDMATTVPKVMYCGSYDSFSTGTYDDSFRRWMERELHNPVHRWVGGQVASVPIAPNDPAFYLHHCNVDRLWTRWQETHPTAAYFQDPEVILPYGQNYTDTMLALGRTPQQVWDYTKLGYTYERDATVRRVAGVGYSTSAVTQYSQSPATQTLQTGGNAPPALALQVGCSGWYVEYANGDNNQFRQLQIDLPAPAYGGPVPSSFDAVASFHDMKTTRAFSLQVQASELFLTDPGGYGGALLVGRKTVYPWLDGTGTVSWSIDLPAPPANAEYALPILSSVDIGYHDRDHWISGERVWIDQLPLDKVPAKVTGVAALWDDSGNSHLTGSLAVEVLYFGTKPSASSGYNYVLSNVLDRRLKFPRTKGYAPVNDVLSGVPVGTELIVPVLAGVNWLYSDGDNNLLQHFGIIESTTGVTQTTSKCYLRDNDQDDYWEGELHELVLCFSPYWV